MIIAVAEKFKSFSAGLTGEKQERRPSGISPSESFTCPSHPKRTPVGQIQKLSVFFIRLPGLTDPQMILDRRFVLTRLFCGLVRTLRTTKRNALRTALRAFKPSSQRTWISSTGKESIDNSLRQSWAFLIFSQFAISHWAP